MWYDIGLGGVVVLIRKYVIVCEIMVDNSDGTSRHKG